MRGSDYSNHESLKFELFYFQSKLTTIQNYGLEKYFQSMRELNGSTDYEFKTCNKIYLSSEITPRECMAKLLNEEMEVVNFREDPEAVRNRINSWVEKATKAHIKELLSPDAIHEDTKLILVRLRNTFPAFSGWIQKSKDFSQFQANAAYFKGLWKSKFLPENTKKNSLFYVRTDDIKIVDLMAQKGTFNYSKSKIRGKFHSSPDWARYSLKSGLHVSPSESRCNNSIFSRSLSGHGGGNLTVVVFFR